MDVFPKLFHNIQISRPNQILLSKQLLHKLTFSKQTISKIFPLFRFLPTLLSFYIKFLPKKKKFLKTHYLCNNNQH